MPWPDDEFDDPISEEDEEWDVIWKCFICPLTWDHDPETNICPNCGGEIIVETSYDDDD